MEVPDQTVQNQLAEADKYGEGPSAYREEGNMNTEFAGNTPGFQSAVTSGIVENI